MPSLVAVKPVYMYNIHVSTGYIPIICVSVFFLNSNVIQFIKNGLKICKSDHIQLHQ